MSVERIRETEKYTPQEGPWRNQDNDPKPVECWLKKGKVEFKDLVLSYAPELDPVLKGLNLSIQSGEKVGVCGRTGAGKSSLAVAIFNMVEAWKGDIVLDDHSIKVSK